MGYAARWLTVSRARNKRKKDPGRMFIRGEKSLRCEPVIFTSKTLKRHAVRVDTVLHGALPIAIPNVKRYEGLSALRRPRSGMHHCRHGGRKTVAANPFHPINTQKCKRFAIENDYGKLLLPSRSKIIGRPSTERNSRSRALIFRMFTIVPFIKLIDSRRPTGRRGAKYSMNSVIFSSRDWFRDWLLYKFVRDIAITGRPIYPR